MVSVSFWSIFSSCWLDLGARKMAVTATEHWNEDHLCADYWQPLGKLFHNLTVTKGKLKTKSCFLRKLVSLLVFLHCYCPSKYWSWFNFILLSFYNLYSGNIQILSTSRTCPPLFWAKCMRDWPLFEIISIQNEIPTS